MTKKVVFIINSLQQQRCIKRVNEFIANGYQVDVFGINRNPKGEVPKLDFEFQVIASYDESLSYFNRLILLYKSLKPIIKKYKNEDVIFFYFMLDVAIICRLLTNKKYIYEEYDLMQTYIRSKCVVKVLNWLDRFISRNALISISSSEGFIKYHYGDKRPNNIFLIPNRLNPKIVQFPYTANNYDIDHIHIGFVGFARFESIVHFTKVFTEHFPQHEIHYYGTKSKQFEIFDSCPNVFFHGVFSNPDDLPRIYQKIDLVLATYDNQYDNVRYAEPNKLYEAIYFQKPLLVSQNTFLAETVQKLGVGFAIDPMDEQSIIRFFESISKNRFDQCKDNEKKIPVSQLLDNNTAFFDLLQNL